MARFSNRSSHPVKLFFVRNVSKQTLNVILDHLEDLFKTRVTFDAHSDGGLEFHVPRGYKAVRFDTPKPPPIRCRNLYCNMNEAQHNMIHQILLRDMDLLVNEFVGRCCHKFVDTKKDKDLLYLKGESMTLWNFKSLNGSPVWTIKELDMLCEAFKCVASVKRDKRVKRFAWTQSEIKEHECFTRRSMSMTEQQYDGYLQHIGQHRCKHQQESMSVWGRLNREHRRNQAVISIVYCMQRAMSNA